MRAARLPAHLLLFHEPLGDCLVDRGFNEAGCNALPAPVPLSVVDDGAGVVVDVGREFTQRPIKYRLLEDLKATLNKALDSSIQ